MNNNLLSQQQNQQQQFQSNTNNYASPHERLLPPSPAGSLPLNQPSSSSFEPSLFAFNSTSLFPPQPQTNLPFAGAGGIARLSVQGRRMSSLAPPIVSNSGEILGSSVNQCLGDDSDLRVVRQPSLVPPASGQFSSSNPIITVKQNTFLSNGEANGQSNFLLYNNNSLQPFESQALSLSASSNNFFRNSFDGIARVNSSNLDEAITTAARPLRRTSVSIRNSRRLSMASSVSISPTQASSSQYKFLTPTSAYFPQNVNVSSLLNGSLTNSGVAAQPGAHYTIERTLSSQNHNPVLGVSMSLSNLNPLNSDSQVSPSPRSHVTSQVLSRRRASLAQGGEHDEPFKSPDEDLKRILRETDAEISRENPSAAPQEVPLRIQRRRLKTGQSTYSRMN
eukprot:GDKJ01050195.1.p1 GENE.GDKJ01050195.1~~GDKJ01050195.1.p1  ORF type:complete len:436 (+),score=124.71 GDKJ01050195.1:132-1310(+)